MNHLPPDQLNYSWIDTNERLEQACQKMTPARHIAVDTEFIRQNTFYPIPGLIQIASEDNIFLIDPLGIKIWQPLSDIFSDQNIIKIIHGASEDLELFNFLSIRLPQPLFDTQIACSMISTTSQIGYQQLVKNYFEITLDKTATRSNWLTRPLAESQKLYASEDVYYLLKTHPLIEQELHKKHRIHWLEEECQNMICRYRFPEDFSRVWEKVHMAWRLSVREQKILQQLCIFREKRARSENVLKGNIIPSVCLWSLAKYKPQTLQKLREIQGMSAGSARKYGREIINLIKQEEPPSNLYRPAPPLDKLLKPYFRQIKKYCLRVCQEEKIAFSLLPAKSFAGPMLRNFVKTGEFILPDIVTGWRKKLLLPEIITTLERLQADLCAECAEPQNNTIDNRGEEGS